MAVFRVEKTKDFTIMSNHHLRNTELSLKAKGLLSLTVLRERCRTFAIVASLGWHRFVRRSAWHSR